MRTIAGICSLLIVLAVDIASAATYYVAKTGDDQAGTGSVGAPWLTVQKAADEMQPGDTVLVREGIYREAVEPARCGDGTGGPIVYRAYPDESVSLCGADVITGTWVQCTAGSHPQFPEPDKVWYVDVDSTMLRGLSEGSYIRMDQLFEDGERLTYAHWPDQTDPDMTYELAETNPVTDGTDTVSVIDDVNLVQPDDFWNGAVVKMIFGTGVGETHLYDITDYDSASHTLTVDRPLRRNPPQAGEDGYAVMNHPLGLDRAGEFYIDYDNSRIYLITYGEDDPNDHEMELTVRGNGFYLGYMNASYLTFEGFEIRGFYGTGVHHYNLSYGDEKDLVVRNCTIRQNLMNGVRLDISVNLTGLVIEGNRIHDNDNKGLYFGTRAGSIDSMRIIDNVLDRDNNDDAMQISGYCSNVLLKGNYVGRHHGRKGHTDGFKFGCMAGHFTNWTFDGNIFVDNLMDWGMAGYGPYDSLVFVNNVFARGKHFHIRAAEVNGMVFVNNTVHASTTALMYFGDNTTGLVMKNNVFDVRSFNIIWGTAAPEKDHNFYIGDLPDDAGTGALAGDSAVLVDPAGNDFRPVAGCALVDAGTDVSAYGVDHDRDGNARPNGSGWDMGAYEYYSAGMVESEREAPYLPGVVPNPLIGGLDGLDAYTLSGRSVTEGFSGGMVLVRMPGTGQFVRRIVIK